jgi:uncharacterized protein (TIGR03437 family)
MRLCFWRAAVITTNRCEGLAHFRTINSVKRNCTFVVVLFFWLILPATIAAQLVSDPKAIPRTGHSPVVFLNGYETDCGGASFQKAFGIADQVLQANGRSSLFFNNCTISGTPSIEKLGAAFGSFLSGLTYDDGQPVESVDVVGYSMGGLIVRSYLSGKREAQGLFVPPPSILIGKAIFIATPNFGTPVAALAFGSNVQADELSSGSHFLIDLNTWNQNHDDLRGVDAIAIAGTGGTGLATTPGFDDGLVPLSSASLRFYMPGRTRVLPLCHVASPGLLTLTGFCAPNAKGLARVLDANDDNARIIISFLNGSADWRSIGANIERNSFLQNGGGILVRARTANDEKIEPSSVIAASAGGSAKKLNMSNSEIGYTDLISAGAVNLAINAGAQSFTQAIDVQAAGANPVLVKLGPTVNAVNPAAALVFPLVVAPRMIVSIYGGGLDQAAVTVNGVGVTVLYGSAKQINAVLPENVGAGLSRLTVQNATGSQTVNLWVEPAFPAVFTLGQSGSDAAAAVNANTGVVVSQANPLHAGEYLELFLTGLGATESRGGFDYAKLQAAVSVGGVDCPVTYAGAAPGFAGLDQVNCRIPSGLGAQGAAAVVVRSGSRSSPITTLAIQ